MSLPTTPPHPIRRWLPALYQLVRRDLKVRYKNSVLGFFWSFLNPLLQILILTIVFKHIIGIGIENYSVHLFTCFLPWMFFLQSMSDGAECVAKDYLLVKKYSFPRVLLPLSRLTSNFVHMLLGFVVLLAIFLVLPVAFMTTFLWVLPLLAVQVCLTFGIMLILAVLFMYYEDIRYILEAGLRALFFLCPIVYPIERVTESMGIAPVCKHLYLAANPLTPLFVGYRSALLMGAKWPVDHYFLYLGCSVLWAAAALYVGIRVWRRYEWQLPEAL